MSKLQFVYLVVAECYYGDEENATCMRFPDGKHSRVIKSEPFEPGMVPSSMTFLPGESDELPEGYAEAEAAALENKASAVTSAADSADLAAANAEIEELRSKIDELEEENTDLRELLAEAEEEVVAVKAQMRGKGVAASTTPNEGRDADETEGADHQRRGKAVGASGKPNASAGDEPLPFDDVPEEERTPQMKRARTVEMNKRAAAE